jgi:hypothetical protein
MPLLCITTQTFVDDSQLSHSELCARSTLRKTSPATFKRESARFLRRQPSNKPLKLTAAGFSQSSGFSSAPFVVGSSAAAA